MDLHQARAPVRLAFLQCKFANAPDFVNAEIPELALIGSAMPGLTADGLRVSGSIYLRDVLVTSGEVRLPGAKIGGDFSCTGSNFNNPKGCALFADDINVIGNISLRDKFSARGEVRLLGGDIRGNLECIDGIFNNPTGHAFSADRIRVVGGLFLCDAEIEGAILLPGARLGCLIDDVTCWQAGGHGLDGLQYDQIIGPTDADSRIVWLHLQHQNQLTTNFKPQPWEQLIKVLRDMGHPHEAGEIAIAKQQQMRKVGKIKGWTRTVPHCIYGAMAGYGHRPMWTVRWMAAIWLIMGCVFWAGADYYGIIAPANPVVTSETLYPEAGTLCGHGNELTTESGKARWTECKGVPDEYSTFQPFIYSLDLILPLVDLQQEADWAPVAEGPTGKDLPAGVVLRWLMWFEILFGWMASLMLVAVLGRLVDKD